MSLKAAFRVQSKTTSSHMNGNEPVESAHVRLEIVSMEGVSQINGSIDLSNLPLERANELKLGATVNVVIG